MSVYAFGPFILEAAERRLTCNGRRVAVPGKAWQILRMLAEAGGRLVSHETLRASLWPNVVVEDRTLTVHVSTLRKALGDDPQFHRDGHQGRISPRRASACHPRPGAASRRTADGGGQAAFGAALRDRQPGRCRHLSRVGIADAATRCRGLPA